jgi:N6-L-threonylcarbamoyladenine synthase
MTEAADLVLGFDTSTSRCDVALLRGPDVLGHVCEEMVRGQAERLMVLCETLLSDAGLDISALDAVGVGVGPGNFTGIRISVAAARGLALGLGVPAVGVTSFEALHRGRAETCACVVPARRGEVYVQRISDRRAMGDPEVMQAADIEQTGMRLIGEGYTPPRDPASVAICLIAQDRFRDPQPRPAPLYLRPADAAPARDAPPRIFS